MLIVAATLTEEKGAAFFHYIEQVCAPYTKYTLILYARVVLKELALFHLFLLP